MTTVETALKLAEEGFFVFPVDHTPSNQKVPYTTNGLKDATQDVVTIRAWWKKWSKAKIGVHAGRSGIVVCDVDTKDPAKDGWDSLDKAWVELPPTYSYETGTGGTHLVYSDPDGLKLNGQSDYRGYLGVDRRAGESFVMWVGPVPNRRDIKPAPEWLLDESSDRQIHNYAGTLGNWFKGLTPGEPNVIVRRAWEKAAKTFEDEGNDLTHSSMIELQYEAIRMGSEGNPGIPEYLEYLEDLFLSREGSHSRPEELWQSEWQEGLVSGLEKYGDAIELLKNAPPYSISLVPTSIPDTLVVTPGGKGEFSRLLGLLVKETQDDNAIFSVMWSSPATKELAREWGALFVYKRIQEARLKPEPTRENPRIEEKRDAESKGEETNLKLLTDEERGYLESRPTFVDHVESYARGLDYDQLAYFRSAAWNMASLAFGRKGFVPVSATQSHGVNLWQIVMGYSGTGKSVVDNFQTQILDIVMQGGAEDIPYDLGADSSIQGLHLALLQRDGKPSLFAADEASGWFKRIKANEWSSGMEDLLADWYMGRVAASNKINLKELRGKTATTSFNLHMFATPDRLTETLTRDQFMSGFLARIMWSFGNPRIDSEEMFDIFKESSDEVEDVSVAPKVIRDIAADLISVQGSITKPVALKPSDEAKKRMSEAYRKMYRTLQEKKNWDVIEPALTRHMEAMLKAAGICALYRGSSVIEHDDALHAVRAVEEWVTNLVRVADLVSQGDFQRKCDELEAFLRQVGGGATGAKVYHRFKNWIVRDAKEIDNVLTYLVQSGIINRDDSKGGVRYELNGTE